MTHNTYVGTLLPDSVFEELYHLTVLLGKVDAQNADIGLLMKQPLATMNIRALRKLSSRLSDTSSIKEAYLAFIDRVESLEGLAIIDTDYEEAFKTLMLEDQLLAELRAIDVNSEFYYNYASTCFKMGNIQQAKKYYNLAISLSPDNQNYHFALANLYYSEKHYKRAMEELNYDFFEARLLKSIILQHKLQFLLL
jgi:tetratricopeptide (TPR) repeat protein